METEKGHLSLRRGVSWSPGGPRKADARAPRMESDASWEGRDLDTGQMSLRANLTRSASLSEKELKEARVRSQIIAAQLTVPSKSNSNSRGVQLFNRRRQRVSAFTLESCGRGIERIEAEKVDNLSHKPTWPQRSSEEKDRDLNRRNNSAQPPSSPARVGDIMEEQEEQLQKGEEEEEEEQLDNSAVQDRHFLPVKEVEEHEEEEERDEIQEEIKNESPAGSAGSDPAMLDREDGPAETHEDGEAASPPPGTLPNGCHGASDPEKVSVSPSKMATTASTNRTARPFFSPLTVQCPEAVSPLADVPPPPSYDTPPLPAVPQPPASSPPPPAPSYPTPPLPAFTNQPPFAPCSPSPTSPIMSSISPPPYQHRPANSGPPTAPRPFTFVPQVIEERSVTTPEKTGILEDNAAKRSNRKAMFTFKEKPVMAPNPELLSLVQGVDRKKRHGQRSAPEPASEEELLALGAEACNFLAQDEDRSKETAAPEWASCLKSSRTRPREEHRPEQALSNVSGKGAELFAKRQSRMEKYVLENQNPGQMRSPSPTMSLPPSWVYPSNMPGRVKAIAKSSDMSAQLSQNMKAQQAANQKPKLKTPPPPPKPAQEPPPLENGCSKIEMDLSRHRPYQLSSSLFILNPIKDPISALPRGAPQARTLPTARAYPGQTSLPGSPAPRFTSHLPPSPAGGRGYPANYGGQPAPGSTGISSPTAAFSPERVSSPRPGAQAPKPTFSAKKAGIEPQITKETSPLSTSNETATPGRTQSFIRRFSCPQTSITGTWSTNLKTNQDPPAMPDSTRSITSPVSPPSSRQSPVSGLHAQLSGPAGSTSGTYQRSAAASPCSPPWGSRCQSPVVIQNTQPLVSASRPSGISAATCPRSPPWGSRCQTSVTSASAFRPSRTSTATSPLSPPFGSNQSTQPSKATSNATSPVSPPWGSRCQSPSVNPNKPTPRATSPFSPWGSRSQSPVLSPSSWSCPAPKPSHAPSAPSAAPPPRDNRCMSPVVTNNLDSKANHRLLAKNIINAAKRKNSPSPGAPSGHGLPISPVGNSSHGYDCHKPPISPFQPRTLGAQSPSFTSPPPTPTAQRIRSPARLYNTRSLTDSDASVESEDSGLRSPGLHSYNTCPRGWGGSLRVKRSTVSTDL